MDSARIRFEEAEVGWRELAGELSRRVQVKRARPSRGLGAWIAAFAVAFSLGAALPFLVPHAAPPPFDGAAPVEAARPQVSAFRAASRPLTLPHPVRKLHVKKRKKRR